jgi:hypothetical protein
MNFSFKNKMLACLLFISGLLRGQENKSLHLTTGIGINSIQGELKNTFKSSFAFNSGFEKKLSKNWYGQAEVNFNTLKYDQQKKDENSPYLFQNTNSSLFILSLNLGYDFHFGQSPFFTSLYGGSGYINLGKPRITIDETTKIATQKIIRAGGITGKAGGRVGVNTNSLVFHTLYLDGYWLTSSVKSHGETFRNVSVFLGMRMAMNNESKAIKKHTKKVMSIH